ncbi:hypothetical protein PBI_THONKO_76 [Mycobacterium phage Thonko]|uniref:Uncharacterized protein n=1 Tax=Mycobacterium phage Thonko TaxID=2282910 RepID=A0A346FCC2_9CAUD|nr:hypothetical protein I5G57_gp076 [Mycobacterium phage Thonko]AXN53347.1 hypothetical protein PBI_THONKO_76 [Mycobacterium phage Thonko]
MGKHRGVTRTRFPGGERRRPRRDNEVVARERKAAKVERNWRVKRIETGEVLAFEPGGEYEQVFDSGADPFWQAVEFAAACLRGERSPDDPPDE